MRKINKEAAKVMDKLISMLVDGHVKIDNTDKTFIPVSVQDVGYQLQIHDSGPSRVYSVAHDGLQNGDLMADPEILFVQVDGHYFPISFRNDYVGIDRQHVVTDENGLITAYRRRAQADNAIFCGTWMMNIKHQQGI